MPTKASTKIKAVKAWAGICEGKIHHWSPVNGNYYEIYNSRADAKKHYEKVVRVKITPIK